MRGKKGPTDGRIEEGRDQRIEIEDHCHIHEEIQMVAEHTAVTTDKSCKTFQFVDLLQMQIIPNVIYYMKHTV